MQRQHLDPVALWKGLGPRIDDNPPRGVQILAGMVKAAFDLWGEAVFDFDRPDRAPAGSAPERQFIRVAGHDCDPAAAERIKIEVGASRISPKARPISRSWSR